MERFAQYIKNEYSINDFDDDDFAFIIVDCGADFAAAKSLHAKTLTAKCSSLIEAEYVLPFIAAKKRAIKKGEEFAVTIADAAYTLRADDKGRIDCVRCTADAPPENALSLELADFTALFFADASVFGRDEDALKQKDAEIAELKADAERQIAEIETQHKQENKLNMAVCGLWDAVEAVTDLVNIIPSEDFSDLANVANLSSHVAFLLSLLTADLTNEFSISPDDIDDFISGLDDNDDEITELINNATSTNERAVFSNCLADIDVLRKANALSADELANAAIVAAKHAEAALDIARAEEQDSSDSDKLIDVFYNALTRLSENVVNLAECVLQEKNELRHC